MKPNPATASMERVWAAFDALDLDAARLHFVPDFLWEDRRPIVGISGGLDLMLASARERLASGARHERREIVGSAGDRVAVGRILWAGGPPDGRFEVEFLTVHEVNEFGLCTALIFFDPDATRVAQREAWARWAAIDPYAAAVAVPMGELVDAFNAHDRGHWRAQLADEIVVEDHRHAGMGRIEGADAYADTLVALWELAPETTAEAGWVWPALDRHGAITLVRRTGRLPDGGDFESEYLNLYTVSGGRITHVELYEVEDLDRALARFEELRPEARRP